MEETEHFNSLTSNLTLDERKNLLEKLSGQAGFSAATLYEDPPAGPTLALDPLYRRLPWYSKIWYILLSLVNSRSPVKIFEDHVIFQLYRKMDEKSPGFYNYPKDVLLSKFWEELLKLKEASRFFYNALDASLNRDRGGLILFLGSLEMPDIHKLIIINTDPESLLSSNEGLGEVEVRQKAVKSMEDALAGISRAERSNMYHSTRTLYCLKQLSSFLFDRLLNAFSQDSSGRGIFCPSRLVRDQLITLNNILFSLKSPPPMTLLESLFVFVLMDRSNEPGFDMAAEMRKLLAQAEASLLAIRNFNLNVPLTQLIRCITRNPGASPRDIGGGEDWFTAYRERWKSQVEEQFLAFTRTKRQRDIQNSFRYFFKGSELRMLESMDSDQNPSGMNIKGNYCLSFLQTFYSLVFMKEINRNIRPILIDGEFVNKENKTEFTEAYNNLIKLEDLIKRYDRNISHEGDYGKRYTQAKNEILILPVKRRKVQIVLEEASQEADRIILQTKEALEALIRTLEGVIKISSSEKYDTLVNLAFFNSRSVVFTDVLSDTLTKIRKTLQLLIDVEIMESGLSLEK
jgi:hypothetical protein